MMHLATHTHTHTHTHARARARARAVFKVYDIHKKDFSEI